MSEIDINKIRYNPTLIQSAILDNIETDSGGKVVFTDPTNPFLMLLEADISLTNDALAENISNLRRSYSSIATRPSDLFHHLSDVEMINMFSVPANGILLFTINLKNLVDNGYIEDDKAMMVIPEYSNIVVNNTTFTLLNDIKITYYMTSNKAYIEQLTSEDDLAIHDLGVLKNDIIKDKDGNKWIVFETVVKQLEKNVFEDNIIRGMGYKKEIKFKDQYHYSNILVKNELTGNQWRKVKTTHSDIVFNPSEPTVHIQVLNNSVVYSVPEIYLLNGTITGLIKIELYTSKGKLVLNIDKFDMGDFIMTLGNTGKTPLTAVSPNITTLIRSNITVDGGRDQRTMEEMRDIIINNTTGTNNVPITSNELSERASYNGFNINKVLDVITDRYFIASKNIHSPTNDSIKSKMDIFINKTKFILEDYMDNIFVNVVDLTTAIIRSGAIFKNDNGIVKLLDNSSSTRLLNLSDEALITELKDNKYFYNPFYYITSVIDGISTSRVFDFDKPTLDNLRILNKVNHDISVNIDKYTIYSTNKGFSLVLTTLGNEPFKELPVETIKAQLGIRMSNTYDMVYFHCTMDKVTGYLRFDLNTTFFVNDDDKLNILNGNKELMQANIDLSTDVEIIIYTTDENVTKTNYIVTNDIKYDDSEKMALSKENIHINFGKELKFLWNPVNTDYTERKYKKHSFDIPMTYKEDIYDVDVEDGTFFNVVDTEDGECDGIEYKIIHHKGDPMLDGGGNQLYRHRKGDPMLDEVGRPIIDSISGVMRYLNVLMLEYEFTLDTTTIYADYKETVNDLLRLYTDRDMNELNELMLDNTTVFYSPTRTNDTVVIDVGQRKYAIEQFVSPTISLYVDENSPINSDKLTYIRSIVGNILHRHLDDGTVILNDIKADIQTMFGDSLRGVKISGLDSGHDFEMFKISSNTSRITIKKKVMYDIKRDINVEYDIDLRIHKI